MSFSHLGLSDKVLAAVAATGYTTPTPIQEQAIPHVLARRDVLGIAQTGTGKTAAFVLPMLTLLEKGRARARMPRTLILEPTRELAAQVKEQFDKYGAGQKLNVALLIGGVSFGDQDTKLTRGVDVLIATPGRLLDHTERGGLLLTGVELLVIDEADRMLDMGFIPDIEHICTKLPANRQTLLFSATMPPPIKKLSDKFLTNPKYVEVARPASASINITQWLVKTEARKKREVLRQLLRTEDVSNAIIFCNRKTTVRELNKSLQSHGFMSGEIHGDIDQAARNAELERFKNGDMTLLVASDVAARGLDIKGVSHVFNFDAPWHPDDYVHRIGRTGRAGAKGSAYTFVTPEDAEALDNIQKLIGQQIPYATVEGFADEDGAEKPARGRAPARGRGARKDKPEADKVVREEPRAAEPRMAEERAPEARPVEVRAPEVRPAETRPPEPRRAPVEAAPRGERRSRRDVHPDIDGTLEDGAWNGPVPDFLHVGFAG